MYKCKAYDCEEQATKGFKGCCTEHGWDIKAIPAQIKKVQDNPHYSWLDPMIDLRNTSVEEIEHYSQMA